jgi:hypothetical protein
MKSLDFSRYALGPCLAAAMLAGCGGSQLPIGGAGAMPQTPAAAHDDRSGSLLYVVNGNNNTVTFYSYNDGRLLGTLQGFTAPFGSCVDNVGRVFVTDVAAGKVFEYAHGGTEPIKIFVLEKPQQPDSCSVDPLTGNLAVTTDGGSTGGSVAVYRNARGKPTFY